MNLTVALTGASGSIFGQRLLRALERERPYITVFDDPAGDYADRLAAGQDIFGDLAQNERIG